MAVATASLELPKPRIILPNVRKLIIPDPGYAIYEADLTGADAQVVAWEAEDEDLKAAFREGLDVHVKNAEDLWGPAFTRLVGHARKARRQSTKVGVHLTNYGGSARALAISQGWLVSEAERFQRRWFSLHPGVKTNFHNRVEASLATSKTITNRYGFRRVYFDRIDSVFGEALAWIPQSTVAITTYLGAFALEAAFPACEILLQVHDSLVFQFPLGKEPPAPDIRESLTIETPYPDPLYIPWKITRSTTSWGDCTEVES
jgi:DNA polymerase-1